MTQSDPSLPPLPRQASCPVCGARFRSTPICSRCRTDLSPLMRIAARAWAARERSRSALHILVVKRILAALQLAGVVNKYNVSLIFYADLLLQLLEEFSDPIVVILFDSSSGSRVGVDDHDIVMRSFQSLK